MPHRPLSGLPSPAPKGVAIVPEGPAPFCHQLRGLREVLSFADGSRFGWSATPTQQLWGGISKLSICTGALAERGVFGPDSSPPRAGAAGETATSGHLHQEHGVRFHWKAGAVSHIVTSREKLKANEETLRGPCFWGERQPLGKAPRLGPSAGVGV